MLTIAHPVCDGKPVRLPESDVGGADGKERWALRVGPADVWVQDGGFHGREHWRAVDLETDFF